MAVMASVKTARILIRASTVTSTRLRQRPELEAVRPSTRWMTTAGQHRLMSSSSCRQKRSASC
jgi:hypothetical protein